MTRKYVITIEIPDGAEPPEIEYVDTAVKSAEPEWEGLEALPAVAERTFRQKPAESEMCPVHMVPWKTVPAGVSKRTGKPYDAFRACPEKGCDERPRRAA